MGIGCSVFDEQLRRSEVLSARLSGAGGITGDGGTMGGRRDAGGEDHERGMWGGCHQGLIADDPSVVRVVVREAGMTADVTLRGLQEGETRLYYVNQLVFRHPNSGMSAYGGAGQDAREQSSSFLVRVVAP